MADQVNAGLRGLRDPLVVAAFSGWSDAGNAASAAVEHLAEAYQAELAYELDPDEFYDYQVNRPEVSLSEDGERRITWPTTRIATARLVGGRDLILVDGIEPNLRWRSFCAELVGHAERLGVTLVAFARGDRLTVCTHPGRVATA